MKSDLVVLVVGQEPHKDTDKIADMLGLDVLSNGFIKGNGTDGIAVVGCALGPRGIRYSVEDATIGASDIMDFISGGETVEGQ